MRISTISCLLLLVTLSIPAQPKRTKPRLVAAAVAREEPETQALHVTHVSLYKNGVGFFEHEGRVIGDAQVSLHLTSAQLNDVLQSLTAIDLGGGHFTGANYNSTTPLAQQLRSLPLSLGAQPSQEELYENLRGARIRVTGAGDAFTGRLLSIEIRPPGLADGSKDDAASERRVVTVVSDAGATRSIELGSQVVVRLLDASLKTDLNTYLQLLNRNRSDGIRHLVLTDKGVGERQLRVSFLSEVPVWKSTYRILLSTGSKDGSTADGKATIQGFSVVDNTTGEDWNQVQLSLIAGDPQSFLQPISQPIYERRLEVPIAESAQISPQTHESSEGAAPPPGSASADLSSGSGGGPASLFGSPTGMGSPLAGPSISMMKDTASPPPPMSGSGVVPSTAPPALYERFATVSTAAHATTAAFDDFFAYNLADPVSIPRNGSALVPILQTRLPVKNVTLWSRNAPTALRALWVTNRSELTLDRGSFSVVENGAFAGEGLLDPVHPGERRLVSYAIDQAVRVRPGASVEGQRISHVRVTRGVLRAETAETAEANYTISNAAPEGRTVVLDEPRREGWRLDPATKAEETTPSSYRFQVAVPAHASVPLMVTQRRMVEESFRLVDSSEEQLALYLRSNHADPLVLTELHPVFEARRKLANLDQQIAAIHSRKNGIEVDQRRLRENLAALKGSTEERALVKRYTGELNAQEDALAGLRHDLQALEAQRTAAASELDQQIESLQIA